MSKMFAFHHTFDDARLCVMVIKCTWDTSIHPFNHPPSNDLMFVGLFRFFSSQSFSCPFQTSFRSLDVGEGWQLMLFEGRSTSCRVWVKKILFTQIFLEFYSQQINGDRWMRECGCLPDGFCIICHSGRWVVCSIFITTFLPSYSARC